MKMKLKSYDRNITSNIKKVLVRSYLSTSSYLLSSKFCDPMTQCTSGMQVYIFHLTYSPDETVHFKSVWFHILQSKSQRPWNRNASHSSYIKKILLASKNILGEQKEWTPDLAIVIPISICIKWVNTLKHESER